MDKKRYIITAIDKWIKVAFARMYAMHNSYNYNARYSSVLAVYLLGGNIENIQTDNDSEFKKYFNQGYKKLKLTRYFSELKRPKTI